MSFRICPLCNFNGSPGGCEVCGTEERSKPSELQELLNSKLESLENRAAQIKAELESESPITTVLQRDLATCRAATLGPWTHDGDSELGQCGDVTIWAGQNVVVADQVVDDGSDGYICNMDNDTTPHANADFIARARTITLPALQVVFAVLRQRDMWGDKSLTDGVKSALEKFEEESKK